jgi:putative endopeptidase
VLELAGRTDAVPAAKRFDAIRNGPRQGLVVGRAVARPQKLYNPLSVHAATAQTPGLDWSRWFAGMGVTDAKQIVLAQPDYFAALGKALSSVPLTTWKDHLRLRAIENFLPYLSSAFVQEDYDSTHVP